jgi:hypothetical protein
MDELIHGNILFPRQMLTLVSVIYIVKKTCQDNKICQANKHVKFTTL